MAEPLENYSSSADNFVIFTLNGEVKKVSNVPPRTSLLWYIRSRGLLAGTKFMCLEGGCGACIVNLTFTHPVTKIQRSVSINSCLHSLYSCHGQSVVTVEGVGGRLQGYHPVQTRLANFFGSQCGYCSPGWVMSMYSLLKSKPRGSLSMREIEDYLSSNVCRCTGYRPILDAFKSFADDAPPELRQTIADIEDVGQCVRDCVRPCGRSCDRFADEEEFLSFAEVALAAPLLRLRFGADSDWYRVQTIAEIFEIFDMIDGRYMLVAGNTGQGVFTNKYPPSPNAYIDVGGVASLQGHWFSDEGGWLCLGANFTLTDTLLLFSSVAEERPRFFSYLVVLAKHIEKVAHPAVRNVGTLAGNLFVKHIKKIFPSDIFTIFETVGVTLTIVSNSEFTEEVTLPQFLAMGMYKKVITAIKLPPLGSYYYLKTYKVAKIVQNSHAYVNAGFLFKLGKDTKVLERPRIVFGGIKQDFIHAELTEQYLVGRKLVDNTTLQGALNKLEHEVKPDRELPESSEQYRKQLALAIFYKFVLGVCPSLVAERYRSGADDLKRSLNHGTQDFATDPAQYPLNKPTPKLEALIQCSGEAEYSYDVPTRDDDLYAALVISDRGPATLANIDASKALAIKGVVAFYSAKDIPGKNVRVVTGTLLTPEDEKLFADGFVSCAGQPLGVVVAKSQELADTAASRVCVTYSGQKTPAITIEEALASGAKVVEAGRISPKQVKTNVKHVVKGSFRTSGQYHFCMETQACYVNVGAEGVDVYAATQWPASMQDIVAAVLAIPANRVNVRVRRVGGGFGSKITRPCLTTAACALASHLLQAPVRTSLTIQTNSRTNGVRRPTQFDYEAGVNDNGEIQYLKGKYYNNVGLTAIEGDYPLTIVGLKSGFDASTWDVQIYDVHTERATNVSMRAPGSLQGYASMATVFEHIAHILKKEPLEIRLINLDPTYPIMDVINELREESEYDKRLANAKKFNAENMWKKRGVVMLPMGYDHFFYGNFHALISIYRKDGTIAIQHAGVEIGQGLNTQAAQTCAKDLGVPLHYITVKEVYNLTSPNALATAGSVTGDSITFAISKCCAILNARLAPIRAKMVNPSWEQLIQQAYEEQVNLNATYMFSYTEGKMYNLTGAAVTEVEIDCLTGEHRIIRVDLLEDAGQSVNPRIDVGQIEGSFVMSTGFFTCEELIYDPHTGELTTDRTWEYKVPQVKEIPSDFRVYLKKNSVNIVGPTRAKAMSEPPMLLGYSVFCALRQAITDFRKDIGIPDEFFPFEPPATPENIFLTCQNTYDKYRV